jgi:hypothetical protein
MDYPFISVRLRRELDTIDALSRVRAVALWKFCGRIFCYVEEIVTRKMLNEHLIDFGILNVIAGERFHIDMELGILQLTLAKLKRPFAKRRVPVCELLKFALVHLMMLFSTSSRKEPLTGRARS